MMKQVRNTLWVAATVAVAMTGIGCGGSSGGRPAPSASVEGTLTFNGAAVTKGIVNFYQRETGFAASSVVESGAFKLSDKLPEGNFQVYVTAPTITQAPEPGKIPPPLEDPKDIPQKYRVAETSPLTAELKSGTNSLKLELAP